MSCTADRQIHSLSSLLFLCFSFCLSPFFYLVILEKKKGALLSRVKGRLGPDLCWGVAGTACRDPIVPLSRAPGRHWAPADPRWAGRTPPAPAKSRLRPRGINTKVPWQQLRRAPPSRLDQSRLRAARPLARSSKGRGPALRPAPRPRPQPPLYSCSRSAAAEGVGRVAR